MPTNLTEYEDALDNEQLNWLRVRFTTFRGQVVLYMIQYETTVQERRAPVIRHDNYHGRAHRNRMYLSGRHDKLWPDDNVTYNERMDVAIREIVNEWERYRAEFFRG